jgi:hypothetical protein
MTAAEDAGKRAPAGTVRFKISTATAAKATKHRVVPAVQGAAVAPAAGLGMPQ